MAAKIFKLLYVVYIIFVSDRAGLRDTYMVFDTFSLVTNLNIFVQGVLIFLYMHFFKSLL